MIRKFEIVRFIDDKPEQPTRFQRKYALIKIWRDDSIYSVMNASWLTFDSSTGEYYLEDYIGFDQMVTLLMKHTLSCGNNNYTLSMIYMEINYYTREIFNYLNS